MGGFDLTDGRSVVARMLSHGITSSSKTYVARVIGEHPKYGLDREFVSEKDSPYNLDPTDVRVGEAYEVVFDAEDVREVLFINDLSQDDRGDWEIDCEVLDEGDNIDADSVLSQITEIQESGGVEAAKHRTRAEDALARVDGAVLESAADMLEEMAEVEADDDPETVARKMVDETTEEHTSGPTDLMQIDVSGLPAGVRKRAMLARKCFAAAYKKQLGEEPPTKMLAIAGDAAVLAERKQQEA